jgi:pSer/pThr/pTyr-binding forkhead associated (FHA) protein
MNGPKLRVLSGKANSYDLQQGRNTIGRAEDCDVQLEHDSLSQHHALIRIDPAQCTLEDLRSTNKTLLGSLEEPLELEPGMLYTLSHGDSIIFGVRTLFALLGDIHSSCAFLVFV